MRTGLVYAVFVCALAPIVLRPAMMFSEYGLDALEWFFWYAWIIAHGFLSGCFVSRVYSKAARSWRGRARRCRVR